MHRIPIKHPKQNWCRNWETKHIMFLAVEHILSQQLLLPEICWTKTKLLWLRGVQRVAEGSSPKVILLDVVKRCLGSHKTSTKTNCRELGHNVFCSSSSSFSSSSFLFFFFLLLCLFSLGVEVILGDISPPPSQEKVSQIWKFSGRHGHGFH